MSLNDFGARMTLRADQVRRGVARIHRAAADAALVAVVKSTPVDEGTARSNWIVTLNEPDESTTRAAFHPGKNLGRDETDNASEAIRAGREELTAHQPGDNVFIQNNLDYIELLNNGSSKQAPAGFVQDAEQAALEIIRRSNNVIGD